MSIDVTMPVLGLTMEEGTVAEWLKHEGELVAKDEPLLLVEMDKGTVEVPAPAAGVLEQIVVPIGVTVPVKTLIARIGTGAPAGESVTESASTLVSESARVFDSTPVSGSATVSGSGAVRSGSDPGSTQGSSSSAAAPVADAPVSGDANARAAAATGGAAGAPAQRPGASKAASGVAASDSAATALARLLGGEAEVRPDAAARGERQFVTPRARLRARELGVDLALLRGSGPHGRVVEADVLAAAAAVKEMPVAPPVAAESETAVAGGTVEPMGRLRRITAERMLASAQATARVTLFLEADLSEAARFRQQLQPEFVRLGVPKLPWDALIAKAAALALVEHPALTRQWVDEARLRQVESVNIGVAVALEPEGLVVPVLRNADTRSLRELSADLVALTDKARASRLAASEMQGGTFTITNLGAYRIDGFTPIVNPPEAAILGVGRIADKAVVVDGRVEARMMGTLSLGFDHRLVDGAPAAAFLARLAELLERPYALLGI